MTTYIAPSASAGLSQPVGQSRVSQAARTAGRWTNRFIAAAAVAQFYTAGLAIFGVTSFAAHQRGGWLAQVLGLLTVILLLVARVPFKVSRLAILVFVLTILQPVLAFGVRQSLPALAALHPVNGIAILAVCIVLERRLRSRP
jgi:hypothetical protein